MAFNNMRRMSEETGNKSFTSTGIFLVSLVFNYEK